MPKRITLSVAVVLATASLISAKQSLAQVLEEVVVTAQKRAESLQEVSISVTAFNADDINTLGVNNLEGLAEFVNGAELYDDRGAGQPTWIIRGVGLADFNANNTPTAAIYYDDFYLTSNAQGGIGLFDMAQVEVLKGPQGGLYGRNASGGAVRLMTTRARMDDELNGYVKANYGKWGRYGVEAAVGSSLTETLSFRIAGMTDQDGGWQDTLATQGDDDFGDRDFNAAKLQIAYAPTDQLDFWLKLESGKDKSETTLSYSRALFDPATGDFCASAQAGKNDEQNCVTWSNITNLFALTPGDPGILPGGQNKDGTTIMGNPINKLDNKWTGVNFQANWDTEFALFTSITGYLDYDMTQVYDFDGSPLKLFEEDSTAEQTVWSQEFRLTSNSDGPLTWLAGAMYGEDEDKENRLADLSQNVLLLPALIERTFTQETKSWALYGQLDYQIDDAWKVHGSLRYTEEDKDLNHYNSKDLSTGVPGLVDVNESTDLDKPWSGHIGVDWTPTDEALVYARITRGFKSGGFFGGFALSAEEVEPYKQETVDAYEIGFKTTWVDNTLLLNGAVYYYDYQDVQGYAGRFNEETGTVLTKLANIGDAEHKGAELDFVWLPLEGVTFQGSVAYLNAEIVDSDDIGIAEDLVPVPIEGLKRIFAPEYSYSFLGKYEWSIGSMLASVEMNYSWRDDLANQKTELDPVNEAAFGIDGYGLLNGRIALSAEDQSWTIALMGRNLTDEEYWTSSTSDNLLSYVSLAGRPASWAIEASYDW